MAARAATGFEQNAHSPGMAHAIQYAQIMGLRRKPREPLTCAMICGIHRRITNHTLDNPYRQSEVSMGKFHTRDIPHPGQVPAMLITLAKDVNWMLKQDMDTYSVLAVVMSRLIAMQPFQDGNKRTAFAVAAYIMSARNMPGVLLPRMADCKTFVDAIYDSDEATVITLVASWHRR